MPPQKQWIFFWGENITAINLLLKKSNFFLAKEDNQFLMSYYFNDLMSNQLKLIDEKVQHDGLILLVFVSKNCQSGPLLCDEFIWEIWLISETWLDCLKLTYNTCNSTDEGSKNWSITFKGHKAVLLKAILAKTSNFWPIEPIELKFWQVILKIIHFNISLRRSHGSSFEPLIWL